MVEPTVAAGIARGMAKVAAARGADPAELLRLAGISPRDLEDQDVRIPMASYRKLIKAGQCLTRDPALALHYGEHVDPSEVSIVGLIGQGSETMAHAFIQLQRYARLMLDLDTGGAERFELERRGDEVWLIDNRQNPNDFHELTETAFAQMVHGCRHLGADPFALAARVTHVDPGYRDVYERVLGVPVMFEASENALMLETRFLQHPIRQQPQYVFGVFCDRAAALLSKLGDTQSLRGCIERLLIPALHTGTANIDLVARKLGVSRQTVYRQLKAEGVTFEQVLDELRRRFALDYLRARKISVSEVAYLVGFSERAAFSRAFKRWTGTTPRLFRIHTG